MQMRHVIAAVEIVIHKYFPIAVDIEGASLEEVKFPDAERRHPLNQPAKKVVQRRRIRIEIHEDKAFPSLDANGYQTVLRPIEVLHAIELGHAFQGSIQAILPAVIRALENGSVSARLCHDRRRMVAADVIESAEFSIIPAHDDDRLSGYGGGDELAFGRDLIGPRHQLPGLAEYVDALEFRDAWIDVPRRGNGGCLRKRGAIVVACKNFIES